MRRFWIIAFALAMFSSEPVFANGNGGGGSFWENFSGPGPWWGGFYTYRRCFETGKFISTVTQNDEDRGYGCDEVSPKGWASLTFQFVTTPASDDNDPDLELEYSRLWALALEPSMDFKVQETGPVSYYLGAGVGFTRFDGSAIDSFWRFSVEPRASILVEFPRDWKFLDYIEARLSLKYFTTGFTAADFGDMNSAWATDGGDTIPSITVTVGIK